MSSPAILTFRRNTKRYRSEQMSLTSTLFSTLSPLTSSWTLRLRISFTRRPTASRTLSTTDRRWEQGYTTPDNEHHRSWKDQITIKEEMM